MYILLHGYLCLMGSVYAAEVCDVRLYRLATRLSDSFGSVPTVAALSTTNLGQRLKNSDFNIIQIV
jgi:hypothetical protein